MRAAFESFAAVARGRTARLRLTVLAAVLATGASAAASGAPSITGYSGSTAHGGQLVLSGAGFGTKPSAAPTVWDDCSHGQPMSARWDGWWPNTADGIDPLYATGYRAAGFRGISPPHTHVTGFMGGAHYPATDSNSYNVAVWKTFSHPAFPYYGRWIYYNRYDPQWAFGGRNNFKTFGYSVNGTIYEQPNNWYLEYYTPASASSPGSWHINDDGNSLTGTPNDWFNGASGDAISPWLGWVKTEIEVRFSNASDGYVLVWQNNVLKYTYHGRTDNLDGVSTTRSEGIEGYSDGVISTNNYRYMADVYYDQSLARVVLANSASYGSATVLEPQIPSAWVDGQVTVTVNLGALDISKSVYAYVFATDGSHNAVGFPVAGPPPPKAPTSLIAK